jgi:hypothetical protein
MKKLKVLTALAMGIMASTSGVVQVKAATYNFFVDFSTKEVANYSEYRQTFNEDTSNLNLEINFNFFGLYSFDSCPTTFTVNNQWFLYARANGTGSFTEIAATNLPDFVCTTTETEYEVSLVRDLNSSWLDLIVDDDTSFIQFESAMVLVHSAATNGRQLRLRLYSFYFDISYDFGTTYLFNYFLSDQAFVSRSTQNTWTFNQPQKIYLNYVYTTAGNDSYYIRNTNLSTIGTTRKKYAVDSNQEFFRGQSVGAGFFTDYFGATPDTVTLGSTGQSGILQRYNYHYLNVSNVAQQIVDAPIFEFEEEDCGSFLALNVGCFINNAFAYITNDAPIVSDAFTLLNAGIEMAAQTFGIIGEFADDNVFGVLILAGFGFIAVKWFLKND